MYRDNNNNIINNVSSTPIEHLTKVTHPVFGKIWAANKDLEEKSDIFVRKCVLVFPRQPTCLEKLQANFDGWNDKINVCLGCCQLTTSLCPLCGWPLHNIACKKWTDKQHSAECKIFRAYGIDFEEYRENPYVYDFIAILRMSLIKISGDKGKWYSLLRRKTRYRPIDFNYENQIKNFVLAVCRVKHISEKDVRLFIVLYHAHFLAVEIETYDRTAVYASFLLAKTSMDWDVDTFPMPHSCLPNVKMLYCQKVITFTVHSHIKQNEMLTINYLSIPGSVEWLSQMDRKKFLKKRCYDKPCLCKICQPYFSSKIEFSTVDEYEINTSRALKCSVCSEGHLFLNKRQTKWKCHACEAIADKREGLVKEIKVEKLLSKDKNKTGLSDIMRKVVLCQSQLHPCHRILHHKSLEMLSSVADTLMHAIIDENLKRLLDINSEILVNIKDFCRRIFQVEFEISKRTNNPTFALALSAIIGTYIELLIAEEAIRMNCELGDMSNMVTEMSYRLFIGLHFLWNKFLINDGFEDNFCSKLSHSCFRLLQSVKDSLKLEKLPSVASASTICESKENIETDSDCEHYHGIVTLSDWIKMR